MHIYLNPHLMNAEGTYPMSHYHNPQEKEHRDIAPGVHAHPFWGDDLMLVVVNLDPHSEVPLHSHPHEQAGTVLEGEIDFNIAGEQNTLQAGDLYFIPRDVEHSAATGEIGARVLDVFTPLREDFID
jgi:quercetin dioxygenase-like cupin family protein